MTLIASLPVATEELAGALVEALGASEELDFPTAATTEQPDKSWVVDIYFEEHPDEATLARLVRAVMGEATPPIRVAPLPDEDWVAKSLEGLKPVRAGRFMVHGSHDRSKVQPDDIAIEIEAETAEGFGNPVFERHAPFDLIIANILAGPLIALAGDIVRHLATDGVVVLSGLLTAQGPAVIAAYEAEGLRLVRSGEMEGWLTLTLSR